MMGLEPLVVVVEDDAASRKTLGRVLRAGGFEEAMYESAEAYLQSPPASDPIALLLDVNLEGMSGIDLLRRLRSAGSTVPVVIITAYDNPRARDEAERLGCVAYLRKPCEAETILTIVRTLERERDAH